MLKQVYSTELGDNMVECMLWNRSCERKVSIGVGNYEV